MRSDGVDPAPATTRRIAISHSDHLQRSGRAAATKAVRKRPYGTPRAREPVISRASPVPGLPGTRPEPLGPGARSLWWGAQTLARTVLVTGGNRGIGLAI